MRPITTRIMVLWISAMSLSAAAQPQSIPGDVAERQDKMLRSIAALEGRKPGFHIIAARMRLGLEIEQSREDFMALMEQPSGDMFYNLPLMSAYLHGGDQWTPEIHGKIREVWKTYLPYRGDTENHWVMWHTALLLAAQTWPDMPGSEWANGRSSSENYRDAAGFLDFWFKTTTTIGQGEFDSPDYLQTYLGPLFLLYDFAQDPTLKQKAKMALCWLLADYAVDYLGGAYTGGHSRIYDREIKDPLRDGAIAFGYMFFGDTPFPSKASKSFAVMGALTRFRIPPVIQRIAVDRSTPFAARERKRVRNVIRFGNVMNPPVYKYNYMGREYSLGSLDGGLQQPIQIHTWSVTYRLEDGRVDNLFALHPYYSSRELGMFFPEKLKVMVSEVVKSKGTYDKEDKWTGGSPFERTFQHENVIIVLYDLAENTPYRHIDYYFPKTLSRREEDASGWIFAQGGRTYIAVYPLRSGEWQEEETCFRYRSPYLRNGLIAEVADASDYDSWSAFKDKIRQNPINAAQLDSAVEVSYTTASGENLKFRFPDQREINGEAIDLASTPLFDGPYLQGNDQVLRIRHGDEQIILDFKSLKIIESTIDTGGL